MTGAGGAGRGPAMAAFCTRTGTTRAWVRVEVATAGRIDAFAAARTGRLAAAALCAATVRLERRLTGVVPANAVFATTWVTRMKVNNRNAGAKEVLIIRHDSPYG